MLTTAAVVASLAAVVAEHGAVPSEQSRTPYFLLAVVTNTLSWTFVHLILAVQVSDVQVTDKGLRRLVTLHGVVAFVFNVAILALVVNLGASLI